MNTPDNIASVEIAFRLYYEVLSPSGRTRWPKSVGPFQTHTEAKAALAALTAEPVSYRITETTTTVRVLDEMRS